MQEPKFPGKKIMLGGQAYILPPFSYGVFKREFMPYFGELSHTDASNPEAVTEQMDRLIRLLWLCLRRNYPEITIEEIEDLLDIPSITGIFALLAEANDFRPRPPVPVEQSK